MDPFSFRLKIYTGNAAWIIANRKSTVQEGRMNRSCAHFFGNALQT